MEFKPLAELAHQTGEVANLRRDLEQLKKANPIKQVQMAKALAPKVLKVLIETESVLTQAYANWPAKEQVIRLDGVEGFKWQVKL